MREAASRHSVRCAPSLQNRKNLCPTRAATGVGEEQHWRTEGLVQERFGFKRLISPLLGSQNAGPQGKDKANRIFSVTECVLVSEKIQKFLHQGSPWGPGAKTPSSQCRGPGFEPRSGN